MRLFAAVALFISNVALVEAGGKGNVDKMNNGRRKGQAIQNDLSNGKIKLQPFSDSPVYECELKDGHPGKGNPKKCEQGGVNILTVEERGNGNGNGKRRNTVVTDTNTGFTYVTNLDGETIEIHATDFADEEEPNDDTEMGRMLRGADPEKAPMPTHDVTGRRLNDDGSIVDIMVIWTEQFQTAAGSYEQAETDVDWGVASFNEAAENSGVNVRLRLVHSQLDSSGYVEASSTGNVLTHVRSPTDGQLDYVHGLRNQYGADIVAVATSVTCGTAYLGPSNEAYMFSVSGRNCFWQYTFAHEVAHNFGAHHDKGTLGTCGSGYNNGLRGEDSTYRTVLSYSCSSNTQCDAHPTGSCSRVPHFSNPNILYNGKITGLPPSSPIGEVNNARKLNESAFTMANHRASLAGCASDSECNDSNACTTDTCSSGVCINEPITCGANEFCNAGTCECDSGFEDVAGSCVDINECATSPCDPNASCTNTAGSFTCACNSGFVGNGFSCSCPSGYSEVSGSCVDVNECLASPCDANASCSNTAGSFTCTCNSGFVGNGFSCSQCTLDGASTPGGGCNADLCCNGQCTGGNPSNRVCTGGGGGGGGGGGSCAIPNPVSCGNDSCCSECSCGNNGKKCCS